MTTSNFASQECVWPCKRRFGYLFHNSQMNYKTLKVNLHPSLTTSTRLKIQKINFNFIEVFCKHGILQTNCHILILEKHGSYATLQAIELAQQFGLNMIALPSHTLHALCP